MSYDQRFDGGAFRWVSLLIGLVAMAVIALSGLQSGPFGRKQIVGMSLAQENQLGLQAYQQTLEREGPNVVESGPIVDVVQHIGRRLAKASEDPQVLSRLTLKPHTFEWAFSVVRSKQVNAFCLPGGKVVVYTGIIPVARTQAGLATVMGHEIGHALAHHGAERMAQQRLAAIGTQAVAGSLGDMSPEQRARIMAVIGAGSQVGILLPFSRKHESEADHIGLYLMAAAGYDPEQAPLLWERMQKLGSARQPAFLSTHPSHERRAADLRAWIKEAQPLYDACDSPQPSNALLPGLRSQPEE